MKIIRLQTIARGSWRRNFMSRAPGRHRYRRQDNIKMGLKEVRYEDIHWIHVAEWRAVVNTVMNFSTSQNTEIFLDQLRDY
jgi:hypothetical protein